MHPIDLATNHETSNDYKGVTSILESNLVRRRNYKILCCIYMDKIFEDLCLAIYNLYKTDHHDSRHELAHPIDSATNYETSNDYKGVISILESNLVRRRNCKILCCIYMDKIFDD